MTEIITGPRGQRMEKKSKMDLFRCIELLESPDELLFDWDTDIYHNPDPPTLDLLEPSGDIVKLLPPGMKYRKRNPDDDYDDEDRSCHTTHFLSR